MSTTFPGSAGPDQGPRGDDDDRSYAVAVLQGDDGWSVRELGDDALDSLADATAQMRRLRAERASFAMLNIDDDYFIILRPMPGGVRVLLSDATAAVTDDIAADVMDELDEDIPDLDEDELDDVDSWPEGDLEILADLGVAEDVLSVICDDQSLWASEQLHAIAAELGFEEALADETGVDVEYDG
ncbi:tRNA adenosine deaminase-associated protein [Corynebacterium sp. NPDC060344]|uniref:tRNA adenosine deaminase-associated protein n=1 Tax=Corynebacterium sp. NPDC060344 TaxID=3347101 RepID=UPI00366457B2